MSAQELSQKLSELQTELAENPELDEQTRRSLSAVLGEIQVAIDRAASGNRWTRQKALWQMWITTRLWQRTRFPSRSRSHR